ncbi:hypothetical protein AVEN_30616-1 [Araneus ventricosus]|uniref:Uncharacterized protein n=1 Tax=Araneus ventricosus TaxID=182803 RepID=A0A4Y2U236_ARAVE|nr:hypothetical protein AVEN_30616-1 [Araneus ventricosus]
MESTIIKTPLSSNKRDECCPLMGKKLEPLLSVIMEREGRFHCGAHSLHSANGELPVGMKPKLKKKNYENLMDLLQFVPTIYHQFYTGLPYNTTTEATTPVVEEVGESEADNVYDTDTDGYIALYIRSI